MDVGELERLVFEQTPATQDCRVALHSPGLFDDLSVRCARPYVLVRDNVPGDLRAYIATNADLDAWTPEKASEQLEKLRRQYNGAHGIDFGVRLKRFTAEQLYAVGTRLRECRTDNDDRTDVHVGLLCSGTENVFDCYATVHASPGWANRTSLTLDLSLVPDQNALADNGWLNLVSPIAYAASRIPGLVVLDSLGTPRQVAAKPILAAARVAEIDYERHRELAQE